MFIYNSSNAANVRTTWNQWNRTACTPELLFSMISMHSINIVVCPFSYLPTLTVDIWAFRRWKTSTNTTIVICFLVGCDVGIRSGIHLTVSSFDQLLIWFHKSSTGDCKHRITDECITLLETLGKSRYGFKNFRQTVTQYLLLADLLWITHLCTVLWAQTWTSYILLCTHFLTILCEERQKEIGLYVINTL